MSQVPSLEKTSAAKEQAEKPGAPPLTEKSFSWLLVKPLLRSMDLSRRTALLCGFLTMAIGLAVLLAHALGTFRENALFHPQMTPLEALSFVALAAALWRETKDAPEKRTFSIITGLAVSFAMVSSHWLVRATGEFAGPWNRAPDAISAASLFIYGIGLAFSRTKTRRRLWWGDALGGTIFLVSAVYLLFSLGYFYGTPSFIHGRVVAPPLSGVLATVAFGGALLAHLGLEYFPLRPLIGPSIQAVLLREFIPITLAVVFIYSFLEKTLLLFLAPAVSTYLTLALSILVVLFLVTRSSAALSAQLEDAFAESEQRHRQLVNHTKDLGMALLSKEGRVLLWTPGAEHLTGHKSAEVLGVPLADVLKGLEKEVKQAFQGARGEDASIVLGWTVHKDGRSFWAETTVNALPDEKGQTLGFSVLLRDFTERKRAEEKLQASLREKEVILKEIHHRVKNNLQVISSLLRLQSEKARDKETMALFLDSQERVQSMAMVHEYLYQSQDLSRINFPGYVASLVRNLCRSHGLIAAEDRLRVRVDEALFSLDTAVPCGLLLTELVSNALKYAYPDQRPGPIHVTFRAFPNDVYQLTVADEGVGLPPNFDWENSPSLGLRLVRLLVEQLHGQLRTENGPGATFAVTFQKPEERPLGAGGNHHA